MSILNVDKIQPIGGGSTITVDATDIQATSATITASSFVGTASNASGATGDFSIVDKIVHTGDTNTAIRFPGADQIQLETNGGNRLYIQSDGKIGINRSSNLASFGRQVLIDGTVGLNNDSGAVGVGFHSGTSNTYGYIGTGAWAVNGASADDFGITSGSTGDLLLGTAATERLRIKSNGFVGIGTDNPSRFVHVQDDSNTLLALDSTDSNADLVQSDTSGSTRIRSASGALEFFLGGDASSTNATGSGQKLRITSAGRVNIGHLHQTGSHLDYTRLNVYGHTAHTGTNKNLNLLNVYNYGDGNVGNITGIGLGCGASPGGYTKASIGFIRTGTYGRGDLTFYINSQGNGNQVAESDERFRITSAGKVAIGNASPQQLLHVWPDTANTTSAYVRVTAGDRNSNTGIDVGHDASGNGQVNVVSNGTLAFSTNNAPRIKISNSSAATSIGGALTFNSMLTVQGDVSGGLLLLKAAENTNRFFVSGNDSSSCEVNLYDANGTQQVILGCSSGAAWLSQTQNNYLQFKTNNTERVRIHADGRVTTPITSNRGGIGMVGAFRARVTSVYDFPSGTRKIILGTEEFDANGWFDHTTNYRYTPLCKGWYQLHFHLQFKTGINNNAIEMQLYPYFNGAATAGPVQGWDNNHGNYAYNSWSTIMYFNGTTDYVEFYGNCSHTTDVAVATHMMGYLVHPVA